MAAQYGADTSVLDWRERLVGSQCGSREVEMVVTGTANAAAAFTRFDPEFGIEILEPPGQSTDPAPSASNASIELGETHRELADNCMTP